VAATLGGANDGSELEAQLEVARRQREASEMDLAASDFLTSLQHDVDPKQTERERAKSFDGGASEATVEDLEFANFAPNQLEARSQSFQDIGATVTDDEFNALFGPTE